MSTNPPVRELMKSCTLATALTLLCCLDLPAQSIQRTVCGGNISRLDSLLETTDIDIKDNRGRSLLHWAVGCRQNVAFRVLVDRGLDINSEDPTGQIPLHIAIEYESESLFDTLVELQADARWTSTYGPSLMERAIIGKKLMYVQKLVTGGVNVNQVNNRGSTPLEMSMRAGTEEITEYLLANGADPDLVRTFELHGDYMGQSTPGAQPEVFAPNVVSTEESEFGAVFNAAGTEFYYGVDVNGKNETRCFKREGDNWVGPEIVLVHENFGYNDPFLSPDENRLYFITDQATDGSGESKDHDIWYVARTTDGWSEPINAGPNINSDGNEYYMSFTKDGTMYFGSNVNAPEDRQSDYDIYYSEFIDGEFQPAIKLGEAVNTEDYEADVFIDPDEQYMIFCATRPDGLGRGDLYISFNNGIGGWTRSVNMGEPINSPNHELCPFVTRDGKYFMYTSNQDIYWVSTEVIHRLREQVVQRK